MAHGLKRFPPQKSLRLTPASLLSGSIEDGLPKCHLEVVCHTECGKVLDKDRYHLLSCKRGGGPIWQHDSVVSGWSECLREVGLHHRKEPKDRYTNNDCRPDIVVFDTDEGSNVDLDVAFAHPWSSEVLSKSAEEDGFAASPREEQKRKNILS